MWAHEDELVPSAGFYSAGGFPTIQRVVVGAYLDAASAAVTAAALKAHGVPAFVRVL